MQYRPNRLIKSYSLDIAGQAQNLLRYLAVRIDSGLSHLQGQAALRWEESLQRRYLLFLLQDSARSLSLARPNTYIGFCLGLCAVMSLGFLVINPPSPAPSHHVRVDISRPTLQAMTPKEVAAMKRSSTFELVAYDAGYGDGWFSSGLISYDEARTGFNGTDAHTSTGVIPENRQSRVSGAWSSSRSIMGVENGHVVMRASTGAKIIPSLGDLEISENSTQRPRRSLVQFASGTVRPESLLAELSLQGFDTKKTVRSCAPGDAAPPQRWDKTNYGAGAFAGPRLHWSGQPMAPDAAEQICPLNRMEHASWLNMLHTSYTRGTIYRSKDAGHYRPFVERYATHYALQPSLVYAIMRVESGFNPLAISHANALGLMQVVPETAGNEVHAFLRGKKATPGAELLFTPESNIEYGTTYLHLLTTRHFKDVKNPLSRELCIIAAYNGGPNAVYRVFSRNRDKAVQQINNLTPEQLYARLLTGLSSQETRDYLPKVLAARNEFLRGQPKTR